MIEKTSFLMQFYENKEPPPDAADWKDTINKFEKDFSEKTGS